MYRLTILLIVCLGYTFADQLSANDEINLLNYLSLNTDLVKNLESFENVARGEVPEDAKLLVPELIQKYGYPCEVHHVITPDGYILELHRIPYGVKSPNDGKKKKPFFVQHGLLSSSADWVLTGTENGLGYILADAGYDVWMGNYRGNKYSRKNTYLDPDKDKKKFWDFSWHEMGIYDLPTMIDYVLQVTAEEALLYAGHSQGTTGFFVMTSEKPEYNAKIKAQFSLAPIAYMSHMTSPLMKFIALFQGGINALLQLIGYYEFLPSSEFLAQFGAKFCDDGLTQTLCTNSLFIICGFSRDQMNASILPTLMGHTPAGSSAKQFIHYSQEINSGHFRKYDYGLLGNLEKYQHLYPPDYDLSKVTAPVYLIYSHNDWLASETDVNKLYKQLGNPIGKFIVEDRKFNHLDYMYAIDAPTLIYQKVIDWASRYN